MHDYFSGKKVLVTGAAGFIGSHLCEKLLELGATVTGVDNLLTGRMQNLDSFKDHSQFTFIESDVTREPSSYLTSDFVPDLVLHFASPASPPHYQAHPIETYLVNSLGTHYLLSFLHEKNPQGRFFFASTSEVYGDPKEHPQKESYWGNVNPNGPRSCYDEAKRLGETICGVFHTQYQTDVRIVRIFNTYGPRMNPQDKRVIPDFALNALEGKPLVIHGDGSQTRSYCYVSDLVEGILRLASFDNLCGQTINIGNDGEFTILETAELVYTAVTGNTPAPKEFKPLPQDDPLRRRPDLSKAKELLQWQPQVSFQEGLEKTVAYFKEQHTGGHNS